ncbi:OsmC family protein [Luteimonas kalidii]|uniref:OsmC family protein n=1 Tax=Luteimonas kalidii TaxID=3042025 RepID=A0ABT6JRW0_9GAMM|nr:OsmC family protein [Luteimonas kalidii]MDH5833419.1 OsmC family protein [Luteimonas kalidii]
MAQYIVETLWSRGDQVFLDHRYSRRHILRFDAGIDVPGSSSPHVVPVPCSDPDAIDPEETFVSSLSSCHMLLFLSIAAKRRYVVDAYQDTAIGVLDKDPAGHIWMSSVTLKPAVVFSGERRPARLEIDRMHRDAHHQCYIANSVRTVVACEPAHADGP